MTVFGTTLDHKIDSEKNTALQLKNKIKNCCVFDPRNVIKAKTSITELVEKKFPTKIQVYSTHLELIFMNNRTVSSNKL